MEQAPAYCSCFCVRQVSSPRLCLRLQHVSYYRNEFRCRVLREKFIVPDSTFGLRLFKSQRVVAWYPHLHKVVVISTLVKDEFWSVGFSVGRHRMCDANHMLTIIQVGDC